MKPIEIILARKSAMLCIAISLVTAPRIDAATINNLYNTGVNNFNVAIGPNLPDPHYSLIVQPGSTTATTIDDAFFPFPFWVANNAGSRWIGPANPFGFGPAGTYTYRTTFNLPANAVLSTVNISGLWATDDNSLDILINGNSTGNVSAGFTPLVPFSINSGFVVGLNTLDFSLNNAIISTGLRVDRIVGTFKIPEPAAACLAVFGMFASIAVLRRRRSSLTSTSRRSLMNNRPFSSLCVIALVVSLASLSANNASADPLPGRDLLKFSQKPMINTTVLDANGVPGTYGGHDELSTAYGFMSPPPSQIPIYQGRFMADDFADNLSSPVLHVKWWGSYHNDVINQAMPVDKFLISFEQDVPVDATNPFSHPGQPLLNQVVIRNPLSPGSGTFTEKLIRGPDPVVNESLYEYNAELHLGKDFPEKADTVYWLKIVAMVDVPQTIQFDPYNPPAGVTQWGWHNRDYTIQDTLASPNVVPGENPQGPLFGTTVWHFQDDAVTGDVRINTLGPGGLIMPDVFQPVANMLPTNYLNGADGPGIPGAIGIGNFSKDLAFELFTYNVPEPASCVLLALGIIGLTVGRRQSRA